MKHSLGFVNGRDCPLSRTITTMSARPNPLDLIKDMEQLSLLEHARRTDPAADDPIHVARLACDLIAELDAQPPISLSMVASYQGIAAVTAGPLPNAGCLLTDPSTGRVEIRLRHTD